MKNIVAIFCSLLLLIACNNKQQNTNNEYKEIKRVEEKSLMLLGGEKQYVEITGESDSTPVLLFIHGGPGWPQTPQLRYFNSDLYKSFIVATWDQRGSGLSYQNNPNPPNMNLNQIIADAHELTQFLSKKYNQKKIYLAGYSWGSIVGMNLAIKYPQDYNAYIGISQIINMKYGMDVSQGWVAERAKATNDKETIKKLEELKLCNNNTCKSYLSCFMKQYDLVAKYNGTSYNKEADKEEEKAMKKYDDYKNYDWNKGFEFSSSHFEKDMFATDFTNVKKLELPVYFICGRHDWNVPAVLVEEFEKNLQAPHKEIFWLENSGHGTPIEEAVKFNEIMINKIVK